MSLHVSITGRGPDLVLLHGWAMHSGVFADILPALTQHYRVHCIDLPGHGRSRFDANLGTLDQWVAAVQPHIPNHAIVFGWSMGGLIAIKLAQQQPLRALVVVSTTPKFVSTPDWPQGMASEVFAQFFSRLQQNLPSTVENFLRLQVRGDSQATTTFASLKHSLLQHPAEPRALQIGLEILRDADERIALPNIRVPVLVIAGEHDRITHPTASQYAVEQLMNAQFRMIKRAGHAPFISHRDEFLSELQQFLHSTDSRQAAVAHV